MTVPCFDWLAKSCRPEKPAPLTCPWVAIGQAMAGGSCWFGGLVWIRGDRLSRPKAGRDASGGPPGAPARRAASAPRGGADTGPAAVAACGSGPDPSSRRHLTEAERSGAIKPDHCCWSPASFGLTAPARSAWLRPPTRRGIRNLPSEGSRHRPGTTPSSNSRRRFLPRKRIRQR